MNKAKIKLSKTERDIYNEGVRDALKEVWLYDGIITDSSQREYLVMSVQKKVSYAIPKPKPLILKP